MWVHHRRVLHTKPSVRSLAQHVYAENILAYCWDGITEGIFWTCVALWRHILVWISRHARRCSHSLSICLCIMMLPNPRKWFTWREGLGGDVRRLALPRIWLRNRQRRGWILMHAFCVSRGMVCVGPDNSRTCQGVKWVPYWQWSRLVLIRTFLLRSWDIPIRLCPLGCGGRTRQ